MSNENDTEWNLLDSLPEVPLRKVLRMLGKDEKNSLRLVSKRWMKTVWQHDSKFRLWMFDEEDIDKYQLSTLLLHPNYQEKKAEIVVKIKDSFVNMDEKLKPLKDNIVGFKLGDANLCKYLIRAEYEKLKILTILKNVSEDLFQLIKNSCTTLVSLDLANADLFIFTGLKDNLLTLTNLRISDCVNEEGLASLLNCSRATLKSLKFKECSRMNLTSIADQMAQQLRPFSRLSELEIMFVDRVPASFIDLSSSSLQTLKIGAIGTNLNSLQSLKKQLLNLTTLVIEYCVVGEKDLKVLMKLAPGITDFRLQSCKKENSEMWKTESYLKNVQHLTLAAHSSVNSRYCQITNIANYRIPDIVKLVFQQSHKHLTYLKLEGVDLSLLDLQPGDLPCLTYLSILYPQEEAETLALIFACRSSLVVLELNANGLMFEDEHYNEKFLKLKKVKLEHIPIGVSGFLECAPNLEDVELIVMESHELLLVSLRKIKKLKLTVFEHTMEGFEYLWLLLGTVSATLQSLSIKLNPGTTPQFSVNTKIQVGKSLKMPCLTSLDMTGHEAAPALLKSCSESLVYLTVQGRDSSWVNRLKCNLPKLRRAEIKPAPAPQHMEYFKKRCYSSTVIKTSPFS